MGGGLKVVKRPAGQIEIHRKPEIIMYITGLLVILCFIPCLIQGLGRCDSRRFLVNVFGRQVLI